VRRKAYRRRGETLTAVDLHRLLNRLKRTPKFAWLYEVSKCAPQEALRDLDRAYANYWRGRRRARRVGWAEFHRQLAYKCHWYGSKLLVAPQFFPSSRLCSGCGLVKAALPLHVRVFRCQGCGLVIDRDLNAAKNLARLADGDARPVAASSAATQNACGEGGTGQAGNGLVELPSTKRERTRISTLTDA